MTINHNYFLDLAYQHAEKNLGKTGLNPSVGTLVVKNNVVISSGTTSINGRPHAEYNALNKISNSAGATLYTTLEPCTHYGKTPPCTNIIIKKKIKKVFYGANDPDKRTFKKALKILKKRKIKIKLIKSKKYKDFYKSYYLNHKLKIPYISAKIACSKDFFTISNKKKWITNYKSRKIVHLLRSQNDCIFSTSKSINIDNSLLNCRINGLNINKPDLVVLDLNLKLKKKLLLNKLLKKRKTFLVTKKQNSKKAKVYKDLGYKIILINSLENKKDYIELFKKIYSIGYRRIFIETGLTFLNSLFKSKLIHELYIFKSNNLLRKSGSNKINTNILKKIIKNLITINLNDDKLYKKKF